MSMYHRTTVPSSAAKPITPDERIQWARLALEEAVGRLAKDQYRGKVFVEAVISRYAELRTLEDEDTKARTEHPGSGRRPHFPPVPRRV